MTIDNLAFHPEVSPSVARWRGAGSSTAVRRRPRHTRICLYSHDTFGLGHLRRTLAIAEHLLGRAHAFDVLLLTGSPVIGSWVLPPGLRVQPMTPVVKLAAERYAARDGHTPFTLVKGYREATILRTVMRERPDVLLVDHAPAGMRGELLSTLALIRRDMPGTKTVLGLRDILDDPRDVRRIWKQEEIYPLLENAYDHIVVYGCREMFDVAAAYGLSGVVTAKLSFAGYIARPPTANGPDPEAAWRAAAPGGTGKRVLVTAGGGGDGHFLFSAYLAALDRLPAGSTNSVIVTGPLMQVDQQDALIAAAAARRDTVVIPATTNLVPLLRGADLTVSMGGYNTTVEILAAGKPAIIVPRAAPRVEQLMRAAMLARMGLVRMAEAGPDLPARLAGLVGETRALPPALPSMLDLGGVRRVGDLLEAIACETAAQRSCAA
ncbi:MAG TPA: glycosyltransferase [Acetobacteraceae bacterium]|nr:glycosyltransferase [Acetobacteraceae bacterium]